MRRRTALKLIGAAAAWAPGAAVRAAAAAAAAAPRADSVLDIEVNGVTRRAYISLSGARGVQPAPLVIGFHGGAGNAPGYLENSRLFAQCAQAGFVAACPQGTAVPLMLRGDHRVWNSGPEYERSSGGADDVLFTQRLIAQLATLQPLDPQRIYLTGFSNGAQMAYRLALELADRIAAIAPMSGGRLAGGHRPSRPVPVMHFHGTADTVYPLEGGLGPHSLGRVPHVAIADVIGEWVEFDQASRTEEVERHLGFERHHHAGRASVELVLVEGMGHQIAGGSDDRLPGQPLKSSPDAVAMALEFFARSVPGAAVS